MTKPLNIPNLKPIKRTRKDGTKFVEVTVHAPKLGKMFRELREQVNASVSPRDWVGATVEECQTYLDKGALEQVAEAKKLSKRVEKEIPVQTRAQCIAPVVAGGAVNVARYLAGNPVCFSRPTFVSNESNPVRVYVDICCSAGVDQETVMKRGLAMLAFANVLSKSRPVELIAFAYVDVAKSRRSHKNVLVKIPLGIKPVNWGLAGAIIGHSSFLRDCIFRLANAAVGQTEVSGVAWGQGYIGGKVPADVLGTKPNDVQFKRGYITDQKLLNDPIEWVKGELERVTKELEGK